MSRRRLFGVLGAGAADGGQRFAFIFDASQIDAPDPTDFRFADGCASFTRANEAIATKPSSPLCHLPPKVVRGPEDVLALPQRNLTWSIPSGQTIAKKLGVPVLTSPPRPAGSRRSAARPARSRSRTCSTTPGWRGALSTIAAMRRTAVVLALALAASGCGGHKKAPPPARTPAPTTAATPAKTAAADCRQLLALRSQVEQALLSGRIDRSMPRSLTPLAAKAPAEIRPDARKVAVAYGQVVRAVDSGESLPQVLSRLDTPGLTAATERINRWAAANC